MEKHPLTPPLSPQYTPLAPEPPPSNRRRHLTRRKLSLLLLVLTLALFSAIFFPVYLTLSHRRHGSSSSGSSSSASAALATAARSATTPGAVWRQAAKFGDLNEFRIEYYSSGQNNSKVLKGGLPSSVWASVAPGRKRRSVDVEAGVRRPRRAVKRQDSTTMSTHRSTRTSATATHTSTSPHTSTSSTSALPTTAPKPPGSVLSILYPAHSYTPSALPVGGTQFYALTPFDLTLAASVTLNYSVFLPAYYDFVQGGKMPGLYGGTEGCGGGNDASDCWSTRMAWRTGGAGELYAYLPQDRQNTTALLDVPPYSYVNADYGM
ncbi:uncharacterized protein SRS1_11629 [Sporisorium reilianum f. sp. reilianum]|uniref:Polysaccharide lyase 14 domain-containing protein n=1 Tax=Sporisorium reilianum f. sp. reilianum TaxID=72559 RepID=A0A2N8U5I6_9BASI|nr:uncharacterized protein SRS1_11629 [Sporisorium reilianum f. sp. reilianum]